MTILRLLWLLLLIFHVVAAAAGDAAVADVAATGAAIAEFVAVVSQCLCVATVTEVYVEVTQWSASVTTETDERNVM